MYMYVIIHFLLELHSGLDKPSVYEVMEWMSNYIQYFYIDVISYPLLNS